MKIALDVDGIICWFAQGFIERAKSLGLGDKFPDHPSNQTHWSFSVTKEEFARVWGSLDEQFWLNLPVIEHSRPPIPFTPFMYLTSRPFENDITCRWLQKNGFPLSEVCTVKNHGDKLAILQDRNIDILIDDYVPTIRQVCEAGKRGILFKAPYQRSENIEGLEVCNNLWDLPDDWRTMNESGYKNFSA